MAGRFDYDRRGILDRTHVRFFTGRSFERLLAVQGWKVARRGHTGLPLEVIEQRAAGALDDARSQAPLRGWARRVDAMAVKASKATSRARSTSVSATRRVSTAMVAASGAG